MVVTVASRTITTGTCTPGGLNDETTAFDNAAETEIYIIEGYIDLSNLVATEYLIVREKLSGDGVNLVTAIQRTYEGGGDEKIVRFHTKTMIGPYRVTIEQSTGTVRAVPYWFVQLQMAV